MNQGILLFGMPSPVFGTPPKVQLAEIVKHVQPRVL